MGAVAGTSGFLIKLSAKTDYANCIKNIIFKLYTISLYSTKYLSESFDIYPKMYLLEIFQQ